MWVAIYSPGVLPETIRYRSRSIRCTGKIGKESITTTVRRKPQLILNLLALHWILWMLWKSRLKVDIETHLYANSALYVKNRLLRIDIKPVYSVDVVDCAFKALKNGNATPDDIQVYR